MKPEIVFGAIVTFVITAIIAALFFGLPVWYVWKEGLGGEAELRRAEQNRLVLIEEARAKMEAATHLNAAEVMRARGLAEANEIVINSLGGPEPYLRYLWIQAINEKQNGIIYIPTEAGLPLLEAGKR